MCKQRRRKVSRGVYPLLPYSMHYTNSASHINGGNNPWIVSTQLAVYSPTSSKVLMGQASNEGFLAIQVEGWDVSQTGI